MFAWPVKKPVPQDNETAEPDLDTRIAAWQRTQDVTAADRLITAYQPFIRKTVASLSGRYIDTANDEEWSIGLAAFYEAMQRFVPGKGSFLSFARLVIASRLKTYWQQEHKTRTLNLDDMELAENDVDRLARELSMADDIRRLAAELYSYGILFSDLVQSTPKHQDTRQNVLAIAKTVSHDDELMAVIRQKKRLPVQKIATKLAVSAKVVKRNRIYLLAASLVYSQPDSEVAAWLDEVRGHKA
ncbi:MAG: hypothetical protein EOM08_03465 [Clostridia bacterium]|nr:hypothetical protein [Clostridia bacterium]